VPPAPKLTVTRRLQQAAQEAAEATRARFAAVITHGLDDTPRRVVCAATDAAGIAATHQALRRSVLGSASTVDSDRPEAAAQHLPPLAAGSVRSRTSTTSLALNIETEDGSYGSIVVLDPVAGEFTVQDNVLVATVAEAVAAGLERATAMEEMQRRVDWLDASAVVNRQLLQSSSSVMVLVQEIADHVLKLCDGRSLTITVVSPDDPALLEVRVAAGVGAARLLGRTLPKMGSLAGSAMDDNRGQLDAAGDLYSPQVFAPSSAISPPVMAVPIHSAGGQPRGAIVVHRRPDQPPFDATDLSMAEDFARQTSLALELAEKRTVHDQLQERRKHDESAHTLHDGLLQRLFSIGMTVQSAEADLRQGEESPSVRQAESHLAQVVEDLNETIRQLRASLRTPSSPDDPGA